MPGEMQLDRPGVCYLPALRHSLSVIALQAVDASGAAAITRIMRIDVRLEARPGRPSMPRQYQPPALIDTFTGMRAKLTMMLPLFTEGIRIEAFRASLETTIFSIFAAVSFDAADGDIE